MRLGRNRVDGTALATALCLVRAACRRGQPTAESVLEEYLTTVGADFAIVEAWVQSGHGFLLMGAV